MKCFLLLILSLMTGCEVSCDVKGCTDGWAQFTCKHPENKVYDRVDVKAGGRIIESTLKNVWEHEGRFSVYHDTMNENLRVAIRKLKENDFRKYKCEFVQGSDSVEEDEVKVKVKLEKNGCQTPFIQTAYRTAKTTISCDKRNKDDKVRFFCKDNGSICENILTTKSPLKSNGTFTLTETNSSFNMSISNVSSQHAGVYWCGVETGSYRTALRKIQLKVEDTITNSTRSATIGHNLIYWCEFPMDSVIKKFICKGEDPSTCEIVGSTARLNTITGKFSMKYDKDKKNITITVRNVTTDDSGTYWFGAELNNKSRSNPFFHRLVMTVVPPTTSTPSISSLTSPHPIDTSSISSTKSLTETETDGGHTLTVTIAVVVSLAALVLLLILLLVYKRFHRSKNTTNGEQNEDRAYEEIQERPPKPGSGPAPNTIYVTAGAPTDPPASHYYSTISFQNSSGEVRCDTDSTVRDNGRCPTNSTVNHPSRLPEDPFYYTVNKPQQQ